MAILCTASMRDWGVGEVRGLPLHWSYDTDHHGTSIDLVVTVLSGYVIPD